MRTSQAVQLSELLSVPYFERFIHGSGPSPWGRDFTRKRSCCLHRPKPGTEPSLAEAGYTPQQATMLWVKEHKVVQSYATRHALSFWLCEPSAWQRFYLSGRPFMYDASVLIMIIFMRIYENLFGHASGCRRDGVADEPFRGRLNSKP